MDGTRNRRDFLAASATAGIGVFVAAGNARAPEEKKGTA